VIETWESIGAEVGLLQLHCCSVSFAATIKCVRSAHNLLRRQARRWFQIHSRQWLEPEVHHHPMTEVATAAVAMASKPWTKKRSSKTSFA
jgi:hypothetical protein